MSPNLRINQKQQRNHGNGQANFNPWSMPQTPPPMQAAYYQSSKNFKNPFKPPPQKSKQTPQYPPSQQPQYPPQYQPMQPPQQPPQYQPMQPSQQQPQYQPMQPSNQQPRQQQPQQPQKQHDTQPQQPFDPWHVFTGLRPVVPPEYGAPPQPKYPNQPEPPEASQPSQQHEQAPDQMPFNPWHVLPAFGAQQPVQQEQPKKSKNTQNSGLTIQKIQENIGKVIGTSIAGYGRINVHVKGVDHQGMVHLVLLDTKPNDYIHIHNSDMVGIYPPTF
ncbi:hypothetical protein HZI73_06205 [Vallitalea pronyensis]|uniref:Uncharacterized protein n=1 Tax=Vallitalea pronyensis TaxID=1348613 RepID=A0A8J8SEV9_9FIRM|nr:hypothetical protein [Vallitalea pronyensis]QUI20787.1 hypothetical protein HZI73_06205 [Vallitalea pronyensis]